ncbi:MAG: hypothetical protein R2780_15435 [Crocinitomicaceae bacterium]
MIISITGDYDGSFTNSVDFMRNKQTGFSNMAITVITDYGN